MPTDTQPQPLQEELTKLEHTRTKDAIEIAKGNLKRAAHLLGVPSSTLREHLKTKFPELGEQAKKLREKQGNPRGRPRKQDSARTKPVFSRVFRKNKGGLSATARALGLPVSTVRDLAIRFGLYSPRKAQAAGQAEAVGE